MKLSRCLSWLILGSALLIVGCKKNDPGAAGSQKMRLAFVSNNNAAFWTIAERGTEKAAKELGVEVAFRKPSENTAAEQQRIILDLLTTGVQGIAISPNDAENLQIFLETKVASQVPLVTQDNDVPDSSIRRCYIGTHNYRAGRAAGDLVVKAFPKGGKIAIFVGQMDAPNAVERRQGVLDVLMGKKQQDMTERTPADAQDLKLGNYLLVGTRTDNAKAAICQQNAQDLLTRTPDIDCLIGLWEYNPPALLQAVRTSANPKKPLIVGFDENYQTLEGIQKGEIVGTIVQNPFMFGYESIKLLHGLAKKDEGVLKRDDIDSKNRIYVPHRIITADNVDAFYTELKKLKGDE